MAIQKQFQWGRSMLRLAPIGLTLVGLVAARPALAHHAMEGNTPANFLQGFLSGLAHPVIGLDHLAFVVAIGLLAAKQRGGWFFPLAFLLAAMLGTGVHVQAVDLPAAELAIALSVVIFGALLALDRHIHLGLLIGLGAIAGFFHGYAYGESIVGAQTAPLVAYLLGFTLMQWGVAAIAHQVGQRLLTLNMQLRFPALAIAAVGLVFLGAAIAG